MKTSGVGKTRVFHPATRTTKLDCLLEPSRAVGCHFEIGAYMYTVYHALLVNVEMV